MSENERSVKPRLLIIVVGMAVFLVLLSSVLGGLRAGRELRAAWKGEFYANRELTGPVALTRPDAIVYFDWETESPFQGFVEDGFSARWTRTDEFVQGPYLFVAGSDDGIRFYLDDALLVDAWQAGQFQRTTEWVEVSEGRHHLTAEYFEDVGPAVVQAVYAPLDAITQRTGIAWEGAYYANSGLSGSPALTRQDATIDFDWGEGSPSSSLAEDDFSVRWSRTDYFEQGIYLFAIGSDDGGRIFIDDKLVVEAWYPRQFDWTASPYEIGEGEHHVVVEYFESTGEAAVQAGYMRLD
jgi:hypothetical protein